ncbi:MAG TPA: T9SS type A sorting domain-containing protein, partial [Bacteroidia bacterium]|nr:T9SS type A sorting domain-containing protein [Bacteroidia bacterium]
GGTLNIKGINLPVNERVVVELFDASGRTLMQKAITTSMNTLETSFNVSTLAKALYIVRLGNDNFQRVIKLEIH